MNLAVRILFCGRFIFNVAVQAGGLLLRDFSAFIGAFDLGFCREILRGFRGSGLGWMRKFFDCREVFNWRKIIIQSCFDGVKTHSGCP